jgi:hypothetical protein
MTFRSGKDKLVSVGFQRIVRELIARISENLFKDLERDLERALVSWKPWRLRFLRRRERKAIS